LKPNEELWRRKLMKLPKSSPTRLPRSIKITLLRSKPSQRNTQTKSKSFLQPPKPMSKTLKSRSLVYRLVLTMKSQGARNSKCRFKSSKTKWSSKMTESMNLILP
jgi:hypothetical protein